MVVQDSTDGGSGGGGGGGGDLSGQDTVTKWQCGVVETTVGALCSYKFTKEVVAGGECFTVVMLLLSTS